MTRKLTRMPYAQAQIRDYSDIGSDLMVLQSYSTDVIIVRGDWLECTGLYSMTTRRHISRFLDEYYPGINYYSVKPIAGTGHKMNVRTGEIV